VRIAVATYHLPHPEGTAAGRQLWAVGEAWRADGHDVLGWCWGPGDGSLEPPAWCAWEPRPARHDTVAHLRALVRPRWDPPGTAWQPPSDAALWADEWTSWPAVGRAAERAAVTVHYDARLDAAALGGWSPARVQDLRAQRRAVRGAHAVLALSDRVGAAVPGSVVVPATVPVPPDPLPLVDEPVAVLLADWSWPANAAALRDLLAGWDAVRAGVPGATLLVAGRGSADVGTLPGVRVLGAVPRAVDALAQAAVLAFPCPPTSGPKMKVLDACAAGLPVVTTAAGVEGLRVPPGAVEVTARGRVADGLVALLRDPARRAAMAAAARSAVLTHHTPEVAARARVAALSAAGL
jgi:hypothetical protein